MEGAVSSMAMSNAILHGVVTKEKKRKLPHQKKKKKLHTITSKVIIQKVSGNKVNLKICLNFYVSTMNSLEGKEEIILSAIVTANSTCLENV